MNDITEKLKKRRFAYLDSLHSDEMEWRQIPSNPSYDINQTGLIRNHRTKKLIKLKYRKGRSDNTWPSVNMWNKKTRHIDSNAVRSLIGETFGE